MIHGWPGWVCDSQLVSRDRRVRFIVGQHTLEISFVFLARMLGFEQERHLGSCVRDALAGAQDQLAVGQGDRSIAPAHPEIADVRFTKHVDVVATGSGLAEPCLMVVSRLVRVGPDLTISDNVPFKAGKRCHDFIESCGWYGDFEIIVSSGGIAVNNSNAQPAAMYHGAVTLVRRCATSLGVHASQSSLISASESARPAMLISLALDWRGLADELGSVPPQGISHRGR